jgi:hypothetical protein
MDLGSRIAAAMRQARSNGLAPYHVAVCSADMGAAGLPRITLKPATRSPQTVLWALDSRNGRSKLVPYPVGV